MKEINSEISIEEFFDLMEEMIKNPKLLRKMPNNIIFADKREVLNKVVSRERFELLKTIAQHPSISISGLEKLLKRKKESILKDLKFFEMFDLITIEKKGKEKIPRLNKPYIFAPLI